MKKIILNLIPLRTGEKIQEYLKLEMEFPEKYEGTLDALYDELTDINEDICIGLFYPTENEADNLDYIYKVKKVFMDAEQDNEHLCVIYYDLEDNYVIW